MKKSKNIQEDKGQSSIFDFGDLTKEEKLELIQTTQSRMEDVVDNNNDSNDTVDDNNNDDTNLRSEQIYISRENYPTISDSDSQESIHKSIDNISECNHFTKNLFNQCLFEIRQSFFNKIQSVNQLKLITIEDAKDDTDKNRGTAEAVLRIKIRSALNKFKEKGFNYKNTVYKLLDKYFKDQSKIKNIYGKNDNDNYSWSPQAAQQTIDMAVEAWYDNDLAREDYPKHPQDYTGKPGICNYRKSSEYISVFTNQQCHIETKNVLIIESMNEDRLRYTTKNFITFPDHLNIKSIETRLSDKTDLRETRIIPQTRKECYKMELVYKKVIDKIKIKLNGEDKFIKIKELNLDPNRIVYRYGSRECRNYSK